LKIVNVPDPASCLVRVREGDRLVEVEKEMTFQGYLKSVCKAYDVFAKGVENGRVYGKIMDVIESMNGHKTVNFEDDHFKLLRAAADAQQWSTPDINRMVSEKFYPALEKAQDVKIPVEK